MVFVCVWDHDLVSAYGRCPSLRVSVSGGSTVERFGL